MRGSNCRPLPKRYPRPRSVGVVNAGIIRWAVVPLCGLAFAVGIGIAASTLASERIGLTSEPFTTGDSLAPEAVKHPARPTHKAPASPTPPKQPSPPVAQPAPVAPYSGHSEIERERESEPDGDTDD